MKRIKLLMLCLFSMTLGIQAQNFSQYETKGEVKEFGKFDFVEMMYKTDTINDTELTFMKLSHPDGNTEYCRITFNMGRGTTTHDYLINTKSITNSVTTYNLLSPFGEELTLQYDNSRFYLYYAKNDKVMMEEHYTRYYSGLLVKN